MMGDFITVGELAEKLHKPINEVIKMLIMNGVMAGINRKSIFHRLPNWLKNSMS